MPTSPLARMLLIGTVASVIGIVLSLAIRWFPVGASEEASSIDILYYVTLVVAVPIFVLVMTVAIYSVVAFRARPGDESDGAPIHGNARLEVVWVAIPFLIVVALGGAAWWVLHDIEREQPNTLTVNVTGEQFAWSFEYPPERAGGEPVQTDELVLPLGRPVKFDLTSKDVIHSFWIPAFRLKSDVVPGITTTYRATPNRLGTYSGVCAELCGVGHSTMRTSARVVAPREFTAWLAEQAESEGGGAARASAGAGAGAG